MRRLLALLLVSGTALTGAQISPARAADPDPADPAAWTARAASFTVLATRSFIDLDAQGQPVTTVASTNNVRLTVSQTSDLRGLQDLEVAWTGAVPTGAIASDSNDGSAASGQEYPMVLLQCRGQGNRVTPQTCWTQSGTERFVSENRISSQPGVWRTDAEASAADRSAVVGAPDPRPADCGSPSRSERWVPFTTVAGKTYHGGINPPGSAQCADFAPGSVISDSDSVATPNNTTYGVTGADGSGSAQFNVYGANDNPGLGCSAAVKCSLVAIPIVGLSCDAFWTRTPAPTGLSAASMTSAATRCETTGDYQPGSYQIAGKAGALAVSGRLWWSASNWKNRIVVPLAFSKGAEACTEADAANPLLVYGSVLMTEVTSQWQPTFCSTKGLKSFTHVQTSDSAARTLLDSGTISMAFSSGGPEAGFTGPVAQAPVAITGFAVAFNIDDANGNPATTLRLNARLLAKLLSQSYRGRVDQDGTVAYRALADNPRTIAEDPEFQALNPGLPTTLNPGAINSAAAIVSLSSDADLTTAVSSYINADPAARKWLDGVADPWGMSVNPWYRGIDLPVTNWPLRDEWEVDWASNLCYTDAPVPYLSLVANPNSLVSNIVTHVRFAIPNDQTVCAKEELPMVRKLTTPAKLTPGTRFVLGIVPLTSAHRYGLRTASLQTGSSVGVTDAFSNADGRTFGAPNAAGMKAAAALLTPDPDAGNWSMDYAGLTDGSHPTAYPGTVPVYADVPVSGLDSDTAARAASLLTYAVGAGQRPGYANGQLAPGALPMTGATTAAMVAHTTCVAAQVATQSGTVPTIGADCPTSDTPQPPVDEPDPEPTPAPDPGAGVPPVADVPDTAPDQPQVPGSKPGRTEQVTADQFVTVSQNSPLGRMALPFALFLGVTMIGVGVLGRWGPELRTAIARASGQLWRAGRTRVAAKLGKETP